MSTRHGARRVVPAVVLLVLTGYIVWDVAERRALARDIDAIAARGEPISVSDAPAGADTPERHDAARIYAAASHRVRNMPGELTYRLPRLDVDTMATPPLDLAELEKNYRPDAPALQLLDQATPLDFNGMGDVAPDLAEGSLTTLAYLAGLRADLLAARGKGDDAARAIVPCVRLWRVVASFSRYVVTNRILGSVRILLRHASPGRASLEALQAAVTTLPDADDMERQTLMQRARYIDELATPQRDLSDAILVRALRPWITRQQRRGLASYEESLAMTREPWPQRFIKWQALERKYAPVFERQRRSGFLLRITAYEGIGVLGAGSRMAGGRELAARRVIATTLAIERYRREHGEALPPSLTSLVPSYLAAMPVDPFTGDALIYSPTSERYLVYSVDTNLRNDGGKLYGFGSQGQLAPRPSDGYDLGIAVEMRH